MQQAKPKGLSNEELDQLAINTIRTLSIDAVQQAKSGHPGTPMALAPLVYTIWNRLLRFDPQDPIWPNRDRFVLSNGHASMLLWSVLYLTGTRAVNAEYERLGEPAVTLDDLRQRRRGEHHREQRTQRNRDHQDRPILPAESDGENAEAGSRRPPFAESRAASSMLSSDAVDQWELRAEETARRARRNQLFARADDGDAHTGAVRRDVAVGLAMRVARRVELDTEDEEDAEPVGAADDDVPLDIED